MTDTLAIAKLLRNTKLDPADAETIALAMKDAYGDLATKADMALIRSEIAVIRADLDRYATKADLAEAKADLIKWVVGMGFAQVGMIIAVLKLFPGGSP